MGILEIKITIIPSTPWIGSAAEGHRKETSNVEIYNVLSLEITQYEQQKKKKAKKIMNTASRTEPQGQIGLQQKT